MQDKLIATSAPESVEEFVQTIPARDGFNIPLRIHRPKKALDESPLILYYHFGGYCVGDSALATPLCRTCPAFQYRLR
jgi:acetyl esterase